MDCIFLLLFYLFFAFKKKRIKEVLNISDDFF